MGLGDEYIYDKDVVCHIRDLEYIERLCMLDGNEG